jgi:hypothetical protein
MEQMIQTILDGNHLEVWSVAISKWGFWLGLVFVILGVVKMTQDQRHQGNQSSMVTSATLSVFAGICLMSFEAFLTSLTETVFITGYTGDFDFTAVGAVDITDTFNSAAAAGPEAVYIEFAVYVIQLVGLLAIIRGIVLFRTANQNSQNAFGGAWHLAGGIIGLNFVTFCFCKHRFCRNR